MTMWAFLKQRMSAHASKTLTDGVITYTYEEAIAFAEQFARELDYPCYGILCSSELYAGLALLSCMAANITAVPLSHRYGEVHCQRIIARAGLRYLLTDEGGELQVKRISDNDFIVPDEHPALIMFTSGTTGSPKGAMISNENLFCNLADIERYFAIDEHDRILICRSLYHCAVLTGEYLISLCKGLDIVFYNGSFNPVAVSKAITKHNISVMGGTPTLFYHISQMATRLHNCRTLRVIVTSGECMTEVIAQEIRRAFAHADIYNVYGLTEASPRVAYLPPHLFDAHPLSVGIPLASLKAKIVGEAGNIVPANQDGELLISGRSIMTGYYLEPQMTSEKIIDGWLYTGDVASISDDGLISIKCRKDNMIIKAGMNIYPQEIENAVKQHESVREALVCSDMDRAGNTTICLFVEAENMDTKMVFEHCKMHLPNYEIPDEIYVVEHIPKNGSGKILRSNISTIKQLIFGRTEDN